MNTRVERKAEAGVTIEVAGHPTRLGSLAGPRMRSVFTQEGCYAPSERSTPTPRLKRRRDLSAADGAACVP